MSTEIVKSSVLDLLWPIPHSLLIFSRVLDLRKQRMGRVNGETHAETHACGACAPSSQGVWRGGGGKLLKKVL